MATLAEVLKGYVPPTESALADPIKTHIKALPQKFAQNQADQMALLSQAFPGNTYESMMTQGDPKAFAELGMQVPFNAMVAYHGTPHKILEKFDISKVGTGEGAQAYGHGMYFAENPEVAKGYQTALSKKSPEAVKYMNELGKNEDKASQVAATTLQNFDHPNQAIDELKASLKNKNTPKEYIPIYESAIKKLENTPVSGNLYKVDIPDEQIPNMLDWDKPLAQQPKNVQEALKKMGSEIKFGSNKESVADFVKLTGNLPPYFQRETGHGIYSELSKQLGGDKQASEYLNSLGIKGTRYLDQQSRGKSGTSNFVTFDPSTVKILEENSKPLTRKELIEQQLNKVIE